MHRSSSGACIHRGGRIAASGLVLAAAPFAAAPDVQAEEGDAKAILEAMSDYVSGQQTLELTFDSAIEVVTPQLEK